MAIEDKHDLAQFAETMIGYGANTKPATFEGPDGATHVVIPEGYTLSKIPPLEQPLVRISEASIFHELPSFVSYINRFKLADQTRVFAEPGFCAESGKASVTAVFDYHAADRRPGRCQHTASYLPRYSDQWLRWKAACRESLKQVEFADMIEELRQDIADPPAAALLDVVRTLKLKKDVEYDSMAYQPNGGVVLAYAEKVSQVTKTGVMPETMTLGIPVFFRGDKFQVPVFIRYKLSQGQLTFQLRLDRPDLIEDTAFADLTSRIANEADTEVYIGRK